MLLHAVMCIVLTSWRNETAYEEKTQLLKIAFYFWLCLCASAVSMYGSMSFLSARKGIALSRWARRTVPLVALSCSLPYSSSNFETNCRAAY